MIINIVIDHQSVSPSSAGFTTKIISMVVIAIISNLIIRTVLDYTEVGTVDTTLLLTMESLLRQGGLEKIIVSVKVVNIKPIIYLFLSLDWRIWKVVTVKKSTYFDPLG